MELSVAVCTRNRTSQLARALESLAKQETRPAEILVIDNAPSDDATRQLVQQWLPAVRYIEEPVRGLDFARNRALREARQEIVAFLDDDAVAAPGWSHAIMEAFDHNDQAAVCTGRIEPLALETLAQRLFEANGGFSRGTTRIQLPADARRPLHGRRAPLIAWAVSIGNGASFAVRRAAALEIGGFDEALDLGDALPGGGDLDIFWRALAAGYDLVYEPAALAWHEHRWDLKAMTDQLAGHQRALIAFLSKSAVQAQGRTRWPVLTFLAWRLIKPGIRLLRRAVRQEPLPARILLRMWQGTIKGLWTYPRARRAAISRRAATAATRVAAAPRRAA